MGHAAARFGFILDKYEDIVDGEEAMGGFVSGPSLCLGGQDLSFQNGHRVHGCSSDGLIKLPS